MEFILWFECHIVVCMQHNHKFFEENIKIKPYKISIQMAVCRMVVCRMITSHDIDSRHMTMWNVFLDFLNFLKTLQMTFCIVTWYLMSHGHTVPYHVNLCFCTFWAVTKITMHRQIDKSKAHYQHYSLFNWTKKNLYWKMEKRK